MFPFFPLRPQPLGGAVSQVPHGAPGFDTNTKLSAEHAKAFAEAGHKFAIRYLSLGPVQLEHVDLDKAEAEAILSAGLGLMPVQHVRYSGWHPTKKLGRYDGKNTRAHAHKLGFPAHVNVWLDLEGIARGPAQDVIDYCNAWYDAVSAWGYIPGLYVGANCILDGQQLYEDLKFQHYWKSLSNVPDIPNRGYQMVQTIGDPLRGVSIDLNEAKTDKLGGQAVWLHQ